MAWRIGIDVGGTFTDLIAIDDHGMLVRIKVPSTPRAPEGGFLAALDTFSQSTGGTGDVVSIAHASTIATNALLGQVHLELPRVAFVTTHGFRDVIEIGRQARPAVYDLFVRRPVPLALREDRLTVRERIDHDGSVHVEFDAHDAARVVAQIAARGITTVAVGFLNSHVNDAHERAMSAAIRTALPAVSVTTSAALAREEREYERFSTAVVNAALIPIVRVYLERLARGVRERGIAAPIFVMQSSGGTASLAAAADRPASLIESGPAGGVIAAASAGAALGFANVLSFDMGGTTAKAGTIADGRPDIAYEFAPAGYPVRFPVVDLVEVSAGGGTIARLDEIGALRVGPMSAGADPGPACYGAGDQPTVTDANVVLGRLNPRALLGGAFPIDADRARAAIASVAAPLAGDVERTAAGIVALVDATMAKALRVVSIERGRDPRDHALIAFGGAGPLHACALADELDIACVVVPPYPGLFSAFGLLAAGVRAVRSRPLARTLDDEAVSDALRAARELEAEGRALLAAQAVRDADISADVAFDVRYAGQSFDLTVPGRGDATTVGEAFHALHATRYGYASREDTIELAAVRVTVSGPGGAAPRIAHGPEGSADALAARLGSRRAWDRNAFVEASVYAREQLGPGASFSGPAIVEQYDTTTWISGPRVARVDASFNLLLERR